MTAPDHHCARTALAPLPKSMDEDLRHRSRYWHSRYYLARLLLTLLAARADDEHHIAEVRLEELRDEAGCGSGSSAPRCSICGIWAQYGSAGTAPRTSANSKYSLAFARRTFAPVAQALGYEQPWNTGARWQKCRWMTSCVGN